MQLQFFFSALNGVIYEEFIDQDFSVTTVLPADILEQVAFIAAQLDKKGFATFSFINYIRVKNNKLYYVDFGSDLGEPALEKWDSALKLLISKLTAEQLSTVRPIYAKIIAN